jgi:hypothetical protein
MLFEKCTEKPEGEDPIRLFHAWKGEIAEINIGTANIRIISGQKMDRKLLI